MGWMIDWVTIRQQHQESDTVGKNVCIWLDPETGERISEGVGYLSHEGSFSTAVQIRSHNGLVEWSGNPSRWGRADNVWGYTRIRDCLDVINVHMDHYGLPRFTFATGSDFNSRRSQREGQSVSMVVDGAVITRVDLARNLSCGDKSSLRAYLRAASAAAYRGKPATVHPGSVSWGSARNSRIKNYDKGAEIVAHTKSGDDVNYRRQLAEWCNEIGMLRQEVTLGRQALRVLGLRSLDEWNDARAFQVAQERVESMVIGCTSGLDRTFEQFQAAGFTDRQASTLSGVVSRWYMGEPVSVGISRATWYRYRSNVRAVLGIDLDSQPDVAVLNTQVRTVELRPVEPPVWYRRVA